MREFVVCNGLAIKSDNTKNKIMNRYVFSLLVFLLLSITYWILLIDLL